MKENPTIDELFGNLLKTGETDKCTAARQEKHPIPCQFASIGKTVYCKIHKGLKIN